MYVLEERDCGGCGSTVVTWVTQMEPNLRKIYYKV